MAESLAELKLERLQYLRELQQKLRDLDTGDAVRVPWREAARPDQLAPAGDWFVWLILAGRGWGKSRTAAEWVLEKARRYPGCRVALVGKTFADVRDTMIEGDSGLLSCVTVKELWGGAEDSAYNRTTNQLRLANGSVMKGFSAERPWRLRGPQHHFCFPAGTQVKTPQGDVPIELLRAGDQVMTRHGARRITTTMSRVAELATVEHERGRLTGTLDHPVMTRERGWVPLSRLTTRDTLFTWVDESRRGSTSTGSSGVKTHEATGTEMSSTALVGMGSTVSGNTAQCGKHTTVLSRQGGTSTTPTTTEATTASTTSRRSHPSHTDSCTLTSTRPSRVKAAASTSSAPPVVVPRSGAVCVSISGVSTTTSGGELRRSSVSTAATTSPLDSHQTAVELQDSAVKAVSTVGLVGLVYNITVENEAEYFADTVLVHNCWADEAAFWADAHKGTNADTTWANLVITLRLPKKPDWDDEYNPQAVVATTPRPVPLLRVSDLENYAPGLMQRDNVIITRGRTVDNLANLSDAYRANVVAPLMGTALGRQELDAELLEERSGALWKREWIDHDRLEPTKVQKDYIRVVVGVDPSVTDESSSALTGIVVCAADRDGNGYVLADRTLRGSPMETMKEVVKAYHEFKADRVVAEINNGGDYIGTTVRTVDPGVAFRAVRASRGKQTRAEPVSALYEQHRVHHVGSFPELEDQMVTWVPSDPVSPDRMDALVWAMFDLKDLISGSWLDAYGVSKCERCNKPFMRTVAGKERTSCPNCNAPLEPAA